MIKEERVKELFRAAVYERNEDKWSRQTGRYYKKDYVGKEMIKSFFAGTLVFILILVLWGLYSADSLLKALNTVDFVESAVTLVLSYVAFLAVYLLITFLVYQIRYIKGRKKLKAYYGYLKRLNKMYKREERLRM